MLVTADIHARTVELVEYGRRFELEVRGKSGPIVAHEVVGIPE